MQLLEQHFDAAFAAPDGIKKLRELILTLAMQGKLVEQDPSDQPASELLKEIEQEKRRLVALGKIKAQKPLPAIETYEVPYEVPAGWKWVRLGEVSSVIRGVTYGKHDASDTPFDGSIELLRANNINVEINFYNTIHVPKVFTKEEQKLINGDLLIAMSSGSADLVGKAAPFTGERVCVFGAFCGVIRSYSGKIFSFLNILTKTRLYRSQTQEGGKGIGIQNLNKGALENLIFPLPPLAEQRRIVARIDELMARCDELEALRAEREQKRLDTHTAALNALLGAQEPAAFAEAWQFITQHFSDLHSVPKNVAELRKALLQLAVMGKLVDQNPSDSPASELLYGIELDKQQLASESNLRLPEPSPRDPSTDFPHRLPESWMWCYLEDIAVIGRGGSPRPIEAFLTDDADGINWIKIGDSERGTMYINSTREKIRPEGLSKSRMVYPGDLILSNSMSFGYPYILNISGCIHDGWLLIRLPSGRVDKLYIYNLFLSKYVREIFSRAAAGAVVQNLNADKVRRLPVPLPPLPEQRRIVTKIDQLMTLCDQLEIGLAARTDTQSALLASVMAAMTPASAAHAHQATPHKPSAVVPTGETNRRSPGRPRKESLEASSVDSETVPARRGPGRPRKLQSVSPKSIPTAISEDDAIRRIEALKLERAKGTRQVSLFDRED